VRIFAAILLAILPCSPAAGQKPGSADDDVVTLAFAGDVMMATTLGEVIARNGVHWPWEYVRPLFARADYAAVNLETAVARSSTGTPEDKQFTFRSDPRTLEGLASAGVDLVTLANNHSLDYGRAALLETLDHLDSYGIERVGAGANAAEAYAPVIVRFGELTVGFIGVSRVYPFHHWQATGTSAGLASGYDYALPLVLEAVDAVQPTVDALFVLVHWGAELAEAPRPIDRAFTDSLLAHGVRGIIGHHPHVLQGFTLDQRENHIVAWSLGNFVFRSFRDETRMSLMLFVDLDPNGQLVGARVEPMYITEGRPLPAGTQAPAVLRRIGRLSAPFATVVADDGRLVDPDYVPPPAPQPPPVIKLPILRLP
jgi:poly-gamma-glutamate synthesis protein (capsule biosynthesis protein)